MSQNLSVFDYKDDMQIKIFNDALCNKNFFDSIEQILEKKIDISGVYWPISIVKNKDKENVGLVCKGYKDVPLNRILNNYHKYLKDWNRVDLLNLAIQYTDILTKLHLHNIFQGFVDLNSWVVDLNTKKLSVVNVEAMQLGDYQCIEQNDESLAPELTDDNISASIVSDRFIVASTIFKILFLGKGAYVRNKKLGLNTRFFSGFRFPIGTFDDMVPPEDTYFFIWNNLPNVIKRGFIDSLCYGYHEPSLRIPCSQWTKLLSTLVQELKLTRDHKVDPELLKISPKKSVFTSLDKEKMVSCKVCGKLFSAKESVATNGLCHRCFVERGQLVKCDCCGKPFTLSYRYIATHPNFEDKIKKCESCRPLFKRIITVGKCKECGNGYPVTMGDVQIYGKDIYKKCFRCLSKQPKIITNTEESENVSWVIKRKEDVVKEQDNKATIEIEVNSSNQEATLNAEVKANQEVVEAEKEAESTVIQDGAADTAVEKKKSKFGFFSFGKNKNRDLI